MRALIIAAMLAVSLPISAQAEDKGAVEQLDKALQDVLEMLELMLKSVPQYEMPEVLPNGDIIIRRVQPEDQPAEKPAEDDDSVKT